MEIGIFLLLPAPATVTDREVIEEALWEVDFAEAGGFGSVWIAEHHLSPFGLVGAPSVLAAAVAQRTARIQIGYAVAVVPLHHPVRLAEEIAWVDNLSRGRVLVGVGPGFSPYELGAFGVPPEERHERLEEGEAILRGLLERESFGWTGKHWQFPPVTLRPRPYRGVAPVLLRASSGGASLRAAALAGRPVMLGLAPLGRIAEQVAAFRAAGAEAGRSGEEIARQVGEIRVLRRVCVAASDEAAAAHARQAVAWEAATARRVHGAADIPADGADRADGADGAAAAALEGGCIGAAATVLRELLALQALGIRHVIAWVSFGDLPFAAARQSLELLRRDILPRLALAEGAAEGDPGAIPG
jgi:alkanesulfonate monooxygenase SsuD/methylene tetrahydromethanopterin reductase-like flavin-dependent oxidoreductase (luciferase family)